MTDQNHPQTDDAEEELVDESILDVGSSDEESADDASSENTESPGTSDDGSEESNPFAQALADTSDETGGGSTDGKIDDQSEPKKTDASKKKAKKSSKEKGDGKTEERADDQQVKLREDVPDTAKWYVVHTYSGHENKVSTNLKQRIETMQLENKIFDIIVPTRNVVAVKQGKKQEQKEKIFPGYILVRMILDDISWLAVRTTQGVTAFVGAGTKPTPISEKEVSTILKFMALEAPKFKTTFSVGEAVKIVDGPFSDFLGSVESIDEEKGKLKVLVSIFGRETPVELDFLQVSKL